MTSAEIRQLRSDLDLSQRDFAKLLGVTHTTVGKWERGDMRPSQVKAAMMKRLRERAENQGDEFVEGLLKVAAAGAFVLLLSKLFSEEE